MNLFKKLNLQLFAEDDISANIQEVAEPVEIQDVQQEEIKEVVEDIKTEQAEPTSEKMQEVAEPEKPVQSDDENNKYAAARRDAEAELQRVKNQQDQLAKGLGYNNFDEVLAAQAQQKYVDQGYEPEQAEKLAQFERQEADMQQKLNAVRVQTEKADLRNQKYFAQLEPEIDTYLARIPDANVKAIYNMVKGERMDELITQETKAAKQRALNNMNNKDHIKADGKGADVDSAFVDDEEFSYMKKLDPKITKAEYAKWKKQNK